LEALSHIRKYRQQSFVSVLRSKNPYTKRIKESGHSITIHYSHEDVVTSAKENTNKIMYMDIFDLDDEHRTFEKYLKSNKEHLTTD